MDAHLHLVHEVPGGQLILTADAGHHTDDRLRARFEELASSFGPTSNPNELRKQLNEEFDWKGFTSIGLVFTPSAQGEKPMTHQIQEVVTHPWGSITVTVDPPPGANDARLAQIRQTIRHYAEKSGIGDKDILTRHIALSRNPGLNVLVVDIQTHPERIIAQERINGGQIRLYGRLPVAMHLSTAERETFLRLVRGFTPSDTPAENDNAIASMSAELSSLLADVFVKVVYTTTYPIAAAVS